MINFDFIIFKSFALWKTLLIEWGGELQTIFLPKESYLEHMKNSSKLNSKKLEYEQKTWSILQKDIWLTNIKKMFSHSKHQGNAN